MELRVAGREANIGFLKEEMAELKERVLAAIRSGLEAGFLEFLARNNGGARVRK
jgi:hypothetical protein